ncbi:hypothetical protein L202_05051 [Cryptococcus amylolentus CBS 6039]|uniref:Uncharacterized protein n=1 Tax=Cryptococcus amylolentus CBS 6039 TaxID=1295533 RepID=A0A1E3HQF8_9TREE|nr:hypothetical protein L202_05051 [Cryptococcus amylolentus CBS 6039]ODN77956.1 hypothetical protein L202_05051 [Cryptococcus amylolentus CBS 6039]
MPPRKSARFYKLIESFQLPSPPSLSTPMHISSSQSSPSLLSYSNSPTSPSSLLLTPSPTSERGPIIIVPSGFEHKSSGEQQREKDEEMTCPGAPRLKYIDLPDY